MYDNFKLLNYSNSLVSPELYARHLSRLFTGNVVDGLLVVPKTGLTVTLQSGNGFIPYGSGATASAREFSLVADFDITLDTADASNPRIDLIVIYVDMAVSLPGGAPTIANLDGPGVVKATFVKGTPNASPIDPTVGAIQTTIGASNPYIIVDSVRVDATVTTIAANKISDRRVMAKLPAANIAPTDNYTTSEVNTGFTWIDGKPIYKKTINFGALPNNTTKPVAHGVSGMETLVSLEGFSMNSSGIRLPMPFAATTLAQAHQAWADSTNINVLTASDRTAYATCYITIYYTKV
ncbi:hypothetical protein HAV21_03580 [Paenarthrobacter sp. MSM-2-10-13]|uniref:hypothetical protein n=1 Tax=Paenarthrobacter sp. MSM-2-10-13 TaxID=2717318 RepID=UPI00141E3EDF|nr:hypothetical protein [Paenarthrobacter sp. MSM-2-10-13]NHW45979.1 hypothetical protein [Paenarthrobacter sp. MSM-2-10-13]